MANDEGNIVADDDEKFELVFGTSGFKRDINAIRNNDPRWVSLTFTYGNRDAPRFSNLAWQYLVDTLLIIDIWIELNSDITSIFRMRLWHYFSGS